MSGISKITDLAAENGWAVLSSTGGTTRFYKWGPNMTRIEVCVTTDAAGRIEASSLWHNQRQCLHQGTGVRADAEHLLTGGAS